MNQSAASVGVVVIGQNEEARLAQCLRSVTGYLLVYVDSGSSDGSVAIAREHGAFVIELTAPFSAARARNAGFRQLSLLDPDLAYVQFVDGDCEVIDGWLENAVAFLAANRNVATVCGRRRERYPERSCYNRMCDVEWDTPVGNTKSCGVDALFRVEAVKEAGLFLDDLIAGEEPELCIRMRGRGWLIWRLDLDMTWHDAAMTGFFIGLLLSKWAMVGLVAYPAQVARIAIRRGGRQPFSWLYSVALMLAKFAELEGIARYYVSSLLSRRQQLIQYKNVAYIWLNL